LVDHVPISQQKIENIVKRREEEGEEEKEKKKKKKKLKKAVELRAFQ